MNIFTKHSILPALTTSLSLMLMGVPALASAHSDTPAVNTYRVDFAALNHSGVSGYAKLADDGAGNILVTFRASGLTPNQIHEAHIHGLLNGAAATCPTAANDTNHDGYVSLLEGAGNYGPIKVPLTIPQTMPAPITSPIFAPDAGMDNNNDYPTASTSGEVAFTQNYHFNLSDSVQAAAYQSVEPLTGQAIVIHGNNAPASVDTAGGSSAESYDAFLPVACGTLHQVGAAHEHMSPLMSATSNLSGAAVDTFNTRISQIMSDYHARGNKDVAVSSYYDARNQLVDALNQQGNVTGRDEFLTAFDSAVDQFANHQ